MNPRPQLPPLRVYQQRALIDSRNELHGLEEELKATLEVKKSMQTQHLQAQMRFSTAQRELEKALRELIEQRTGNARDLQVCRERERERGVTETETVLVQHQATPECSLL